MKDKQIVFILCLLIAMAGALPERLLAQSVDDIDEIIPLEILKGRAFDMIISSKGYLILSSEKEKKNYILETNFRKELSDEIKEIAQNNWEVEIGGITKGMRQFTFVDFSYPEAESLQEKGEVKKEGKRIILPVIDVAMIQSVNKEVLPQEPPDLFTTFEVPPDFQKEYGSPVELRQVRGTVSKCNFKNVIPTIELEEKPDLAIILLGDVEAVKVVGGNLTAFNPKEVIKEGTKVEIWYEEKGDLNTARIIIVQEKDTSGK